MNTETAERVAQRALKLIRDGHHYRFAVVRAVYETGAADDDYWKVLSALRILVKKDHALRFVARKMARAMDKPGEPKEFQTCFPVGSLHATD
ncbi:MAG: hypothetical protein A3D52_02715 [Candidatus Taylorbacteria bacterium RIFCSPHIGHO2_02_FULL_44_36]|uniref:Uncharacterized protein n=1 Tax=Candidatus Taylorbacteria bacterium RIFCSPLOWO2_12_FULL_44_15c TaxID=1802333 RepID=A0A1G2P7V0_9BACT|nr:MAG: hypothetical protein A3D52_02715 [Candidatus Taylorbacteria bacterium RIFCSPHIGHO2_02_FULL_44_36]OHA38067.1 MAG: hypothetical protein A3I97_03155 [Candidatus Taylorbacteria bacterium RIFCSPLOWO2_02_FULL_44_35]OHA44434.1 MAG: hypothetical protein A3G03_02425 [Candidatus Taylorbacteria bacterium RIFCSPLOWO2_12_FULL_44_15c]